MADRRGGRGLYGAVRIGVVLVDGRGIARLRRLGGVRPGLIGDLEGLAGARVAGVVDLAQRRDRGGGVVAGDAGVLERSGERVAVVEG